MTFWEDLRTIVTAIGLVTLFVWLMFRWLIRSDDPGRLVFRWVLTLLDLLFLLFFVVPMTRSGGYTAAFGGVPMAAVGGLFMAIIWTPSLTEYCGRRMGALYDGGDTPPDPEPFYSIAEARRKQGKYEEALALVRGQLVRFPNDVRGFMLLANIQAESLHDLAAAEETIELFVAQPGHAAKNVAFALTQLADWHLKLARDPAGARRAFARILELFPDSPEAHLARQRVAHVANAELLAAPELRQPLKVEHLTDDVGLRRDFSGFKAPPRDPNARATELVGQLELYPDDNQTREELAVLYAEEFHRLDLAADQFEQLITQPHAPPNQVVRWLGLLADFQLREAGDADAARQTLLRLVERFPDTPAAECAQRRLGTLKLTAKAAAETRSLKLSPAEPNLGLGTGV